MTDRSTMDAPQRVVSRPQHAPTWRDLPQPLPVEERVWPPRAPEVPSAVVQDSLPVAAPPPVWQSVRQAWRDRSLVAAPVPAWTPVVRRQVRRKNVALAALLGLLLGPIGLFYVGWRHVVAALVAGGVVVTGTLAAALASGDPEEGLVAVVVQFLLVPPVSAGWGAVAAWWRNRVPRQV